MTPVAVRQHLDKLTESGLIELMTGRPRSGSPARVSSLTLSSTGRFPTPHSRVAGFTAEEMVLVHAAALRVTDGDRDALMQFPLPERAEVAVAIVCDGSGFVELHRATDALEVRD